MASGATQEFLDYLQQRVFRLWAIAGAALLAGVVLAVATSGRAAVLGAVLLIAGGLVALSALLGQRTVRRARNLADGPSRALQMWTYPISGRAGWVAAVLATFDEVGSVNRTPGAQVKTAWFTAGIAEKPPAVAEVYGGIEPGGAILAVNEHGGVAGKVKILHP